MTRASSLVTGHRLFTKITKDLKIPFIMSANIRENLRLVSNIRENLRHVSSSIGVNPRLVDSRVMLPYLRCRTTLVSIRAHKVSPRW
jgi:hypothetical protein